KIFFFYSVFSGISFGFIINYFTAAPFIIQNTYHIKPLHTGLYLLFMPVSLIVGAFVAKYLAQCKMKAANLVTIYAISFLVVSLVSLILSYFIQSIALLVIMIVIIGFLCGLIMPVLTGESVSTIDASIGTAMASSIQVMIKMLMTAACMMIGLTIHVKTTTDLLLIFIILSVMLNTLLLFMSLMKKVDKENITVTLK
ncbi:MAG: hypothetical protein AAGA27_07905, partial [Pseudomonadota bacterium]